MPCTQGGAPLPLPFRGFAPSRENKCASELYQGGLRIICADGCPEN